MPLYVKGAGCHDMPAEAGRGSWIGSISLSIEGKTLPTP